jgi:hypothetical protein
MTGRASRRIESSYGGGHYAHLLLPIRRIHPAKWFQAGKTAGRAIGRRLKFAFPRRAQAYDALVRGDHRRPGAVDPLEFANNSEMLGAIVQVRETGSGDA